MKNKKYNIGLDIGTSSIGYTITDDGGRLVHVRGKLGYGVRIFEEGKTAAERRGFRTTRRRLNRRKWRLRFLREIFEPYINEIDENFFMRQKESNLVKQDKQHTDGHFLFNDREDKDFYHDYPTIYHLRQALMTEQRKFDIREIYWALHHIVKYRGHFLSEAPVQSFKVGKLDLKQDFEKLNELFVEVLTVTDEGEQFQLKLDQVDAVKATLLDRSLTSNDRQKQLAPTLYEESHDKKVDKQFKSISTELLKAIVGLKSKINVIVGIESKNTIWNIDLGNEEIDEKLSAVDDQLDDLQREIIETLQKIYSAITLAAIIPNGMGLSESMMERYNRHDQQLRQYKQLSDDLGNPKREALRNAYKYYITSKNEKDKSYTKDDFYKAVPKILKDVDDERATAIQRSIDLDEFMPKQRTKANCVMPHQLHQQELDQIIENQKEYYPWLAEPNPNQKRRNAAQYKLDELVAFRVPYYIGPMVTPTGKNPQEAKFAWTKRREGHEKDEITPWNFDQVVDRKATAERFIKRMTTKDTYLLNEDVLPKQSLLYQRYEVLSELNNVRVNGDRLETPLKQNVFEDVFKHVGNVTIKRFRDYLISDGDYSADKLEVKGLADPTKFLSGLTSYNDLKKVFLNRIDDPMLQPDIEKIIEWLTIFEDSKILREKLNDIDWLTDADKDALAKKRYRGWGRFSRKLLSGLADENGQSIITRMWESDKNFMELVNQTAYSQQIVTENQQLLKQQDLSTVINDLYTSPQNKKALRQVLLVVKDIQKAMGGQAPDKVFIEFAREDEADPRRTTSRANHLKQVYQGLSDELLASSAIRSQLNSEQYSMARDRYYLYFAQGGRDLYTGESISIDDISSYDIDHILPQSFIKDDSLDNRVLVNQTSNREKADNLPGETLVNKMRSLWKRQLDAGMMTKRKFNNLTLTHDKVNKYQKTGFVRRQLVETRQVIKFVANILADEYQNDDTKIISVKANLTHQMREDFDFPKNRNVNNYHHAFDAYLTTVVGLHLLEHYPKLSKLFTYGEFFKGELPNLGSFNFLHDLGWVDPKHNDKKMQRSDAYQELWDRLDHIYDFKKVTVTHEVFENHGALYERTLYKATDDKGSGRGSKQLIPKKKNMPTELYGGYTGATSAFMTIVRLKKKDEFYYKVFGIPTRIADKISNGKEIKLDKLLEYMKRQFTSQKINKKTGEVVSKVEPFEIIAPKISYRQLVVDEGQPFMLGTATYRHNARELYLSKNMIRAINQGEQLDAVYSEILKSVHSYFPMYKINKFIAKLTEGESIFDSLPNNTQYESGKILQIGKHSVIDRILIGLHANASVSDLKVLGISTPFGFMQQGRGITLTSDAKLIYQSPTGLYEKIVALKDLKPLA